MKHLALDFERMGRIMKRTAREEMPLPAGYPYPKLAACPDLVDGYPACYCVIYPERLKLLNIDRRGASIPCEGLPPALRHYSLNGFYIRCVDGRLELAAGRNGTSNEDLCRHNLELDADIVMAALHEVGADLASHGGSNADNN